MLPIEPANGRDTTRGQLSILAAGGRRGASVSWPPRSAPSADSPTPPSVHAKIGIVYDRWLTIGSGNLNEHSLFNDTEMNLLMNDPDLAATPGSPRAEHTERAVR